MSIHIPRSVELTIERDDPVACYYYNECASMFAAGTILQVANTDRGSYRLCPGHFNQLCAKYEIERPPNCDQTQQRIERSRISGSPNFIVPSAPVAQTPRIEVIEHDIARAQRGEGPSVQAAPGTYSMPPPSSNIAHKLNPGYNSNHLQYPAMVNKAVGVAFGGGLTASASSSGRFSKAPVLTAAFDKKVTCQVSLRHEKSGVANPKLIANIQGTFQLLPTQTVGTLMSQGWKQLHARFLSFTNGHQDLITPLNALSFIQKNGLSLLDKLNLPMSTVFDNLRKVLKVEVYFVMTEVAYSQLCTDIENAAQYDDDDDNDGGANFQSAPYLKRQDSPFNAIIFEAAVLPKDNESRGTKRKALEPPTEERQAKILRPEEGQGAVMTEYDGTRVFRGHTCLNFADVDDAIDATPDFSAEEGVGDLRLKDAHEVDIIFPDPDLTIKKIVQALQKFKESYTDDLTHRRGDLSIDETPLGEGNEKMCYKAHLYLPYSNRKRSEPLPEIFSGQIVAKRLKQDTGTVQENTGSGEVAFYPAVAERRLGHKDLFHHSWIIAIWHEGFRLEEHLQKLYPGMPTPPRVRLARTALAVKPDASTNSSTKTSAKTAKSAKSSAKSKIEGPNAHGAWLIEERIYGNWVKYISNRTSVLDFPPNTPSKVKEIAEYCSFLQHCQWLGTRGKLFLTDFQGVDGVLSDLQVLCDGPKNPFGRGNVRWTLFSFPDEHSCATNRWCTHFQLEPPKHWPDHTNKQPWCHDSRVWAGAGVDEYGDEYDVRELVNMDNV
ncbi:hypothetical protein M408DRAFT_24793 [Serendipita vermifera MAFF 305830]|uniref:Alpha-type protein kinase domain-containing protein n=1 Tax=Serendipita vermifera MAFF 305830 TaxID=933852 RepID=A0A0C2WL51_SERVB|nr:hypothetical protein M408DRAFT_24793 [Serendipita vermifera MAFF 305830]